MLVPDASCVHPRCVSHTLQTHSNVTLELSFTIRIYIYIYHFLVFLLVYFTVEITLTILTQIAEEFDIHVDLNKIFPHLLEHQLLTSDQYHSFLSTKQKMILHLKQKQHGVLQKLLCCLYKETTHLPHNVVAFKLTNMMKLFNIPCQQLCLICKLKQSSLLLSKSNYIAASCTPIKLYCTEVKCKQDGQTSKVVTEAKPEDTTGFLSVNDRTQVDIQTSEVNVMSHHAEHVNQRLEPAGKLFIFTNA